MPEWTPKQRAAIQARNRSILVSAAAGSGKTTVLIERIMALLREGVGIEHMLVVTFTRAAACAANASSDLQTRIAAVQVCGEMRIKTSAATLRALADDPAANTVLRLAARHALSQLSE